MPETNKDTAAQPAEAGTLHTLLDHIEDPIWLVDRDCMIVACNAAFKKWVFHFIGTELSAGDHVLYNGRDRLYNEKFEMCYQLALSGRAFRSVEDVQAENTTRYTSVCFNPVHDKDGNVTGVSCYARDITDQRKHLMKIEQQNSALREIAFIESHKVRGPVATILGLEQLFNYDDLTDPINKIIMEGVAETTRKLDLIVREVVQRSTEIGLQP